MRALAAFFQGWGGLGRFWGLMLALLAAGAGTLAALGPPTPRVAKPPLAHPVAAVAPAPPTREPVVIRPMAPSARVLADRPGRDTPGPIVDPDPALLEPVPGSTREFLPRIAADGRKPMRLYAAAFDTTSTRPRIGLLLAGIGLSFADSKKAIVDMPGEVTLAISPYAVNPEALLSSARVTGHEYLISIPMEPLGFPLNDPGPAALMTTLSPQQNLPRLRQALSRVQGYVGAASVLGAMRGERLTDLPEQMAPVLAELEQRGLLYVGPPTQPGPVPNVWSRTVELVIDEPATAAEIDAKLAALEILARDRGAVLGMATAPRPMTVERILAWTNGLANRGLALAPVSALAVPPFVEKEPSR